MKAQVSLELLIILALVLMVSDVSVILVKSSTQTNKQVMVINNCQVAAQQCASIHRADSTYDCGFCEVQCVDSASDEEVFPGAINCCKEGNDSAVFIGSNGC